ncbi:MAG: glycosyltransferase family 39 protein [Candidatus Omnitrophica bacterium]|nr:glycosyltransferase family 39 protein [Candidatus Omnitrophota bacterium]MBU1928431.1 glycosyltransferase family 39 protein [Candidatus Omnitrophota bacterium]
MQKLNSLTHLREEQKNALMLWLILTLAIAIRIYKLGDADLWYDEVYAYFMTTLTYGDITRKIFGEQFYLYNILLKFWVFCFGMSEFSLRFLSMLFGVVSVPIMYKIGKLLFNTKVGLIGSFLLSISPIHVWYSQEARGYSLSIFITLLIIYFFIRVLKESKVYLWIGLILSSLISIYINYFCFYAIILTSIALFLRRYKYIFKLGLVYILIIISGFLLLAPSLIRYISKLSSSFWVSKPNLGAIGITLDNFNIGYNATPGVYFITSVVFFLLFILGVFFWWQDRKKVLAFLLFCIFSPIIFTFLISQLIPIYLDRNLILYSPFYYIIIAAGIEKIRLKSLQIIVYVIILSSVVLCLRNYFTYNMPAFRYHSIGVYVKKPVEPAVDYIGKRFIEGDAIGYSGPVGSTISYYIQKKISKNIDIFSFVILNKIGPYWKNFKGKYLRGYTQNRCVPIFLDNERSSERFKNKKFKRLWLISMTWSRGNNLGFHEAAIREWIQRDYLVLDRKEFDGIFIDLYGRKID